MTPAKWTQLSLVTAINVLVASGFSIAGLIMPQSVLPPGAVPTEASLIFAMYTAGRAVPLAAITVAAIYKRSTSGLLILGTLAGVIQLVDAAISLVQRDWGKSAGPFVIAILQFYLVVTAQRSSDPLTRPSSTRGRSTHPLLKGKA